MQLGGTNEKTGQAICSLLGAQQAQALGASPHPNHLLLVERR
jgi:hypothetical protein